MDELMALAICMVIKERLRQIEKWGDQSGNTLPEWMAILGEEFGELCESANETHWHTPHSKPERGGYEAIKREAVHVAAVAVAIVEAVTRQQVKEASE